MVTISPEFPGVSPALLPIAERGPEALAPRAAPGARAVPTVLALTLLSVLAGFSTGANAIESPWYAGVGGSAATLQPDAFAIEKDVDESTASGGTLFIGRDLDARSSLQLQLHGLGFAVFDADTVMDEERIGYTAADASLLYRLATTQARNGGGQGFGATLYARLGVGAIMRDTDLRLDDNNDVYLGAGAGVELRASKRIALRAEGIYFDRDASAASLSLVARLGGPGGRWPSPPSAKRLDVAKPGSTLPALAVERLPEPAGASASNPTPATAPAPDATLPSRADISELALAPLSTSAGAGSARAAEPDAAGPTLVDPALAGPALADSSLVEPSLAEPALAEPLARPAAVAAAGLSNGEPRLQAASELPQEITLAAASDTSLVVTESAIEVAANDEADSDGDGVADSADACPRSSVGFPVRADGCPLLEGILSGVRFAPQSAALLPDATAQLDNLAKLLTDYPLARVELLAHTDDAGTVREQSIVTRARLKTLALYLIHDKGIRANRIALRSLGGIRPLYENTTAEGRRRNNRIEIKENTTAE